VSVKFRIVALPQGERGKEAHLSRGGSRPYVTLAMPEKIAIILPPGEGFAPGDTGGIGLLVHRLAVWPGQFVATVIGPPQAAPFADVAFQPARPLWLPATYARRYAGGVARVLADIVPALIEVHNRPDLALFLAARFPETPVSLLLHNDPHGMRRATTATQRAELLAHVAKVITVSTFLRGRLLNNIPNPTRIPGVLPNCIDLREIPPPPAERDPVILFAGRVVADKGADTFVAACARALPQLPGWRAEMIGADRFGPDSPETPFLRALRPKAQEAGVVMAGYRPHAEVLAAMSRAAIVVVPSRWAEPFGLTALEALACGAALLCSARGGLPEVYGHAGQRIEPENPNTIADAITALACDPARRAALGAAGIARARLFDVPQTAAALDALRAELLDAWSRGMARPI
jgi:UDP-glucose:(glucosyl)LPS alpha-1,2-glucosyltransferase